MGTGGQRGTGGHRRPDLPYSGHTGGSTRGASLQGSELEQQPESGSCLVQGERLLWERDSFGRETPLGGRLLREGLWGRSEAWSPTGSFRAGWSLEQRDSPWQDLDPHLGAPWAPLPNASPGDGASHRNHGHIKLMKAFPGQGWAGRAP